jgi:hypothetical protein
MIGFIVIALFSLTPLGCGGGGKNFSPEDFKKVVGGMSEEQVKEILGNPTETLKPIGFKISIWSVGDKYYTITYGREGKVEKQNGPTNKDEIDDLRKVFKEHREN